MTTRNVLGRVLFAAVLLASCGPGKSTKSSPELDSVVLSSTTVSLAQGGVAPLVATVTASNEPAGTIQLGLTGAPAGLSVSPASLAFSGTSQQLSTSLVATDVTPTGAYPLTLTATMGSLTATTSLTVTVTAGSGSLTVSVLAPSNVTLTPSVSVLDAQGTSVATVTTVGDKVIPDLPAGTYTVTATAVTQGGISYAPTVSGSPAMVQVNQTARATVDYGATSGELAVTVSAPAGVTPSVSVTNASGTVLQTIVMTGATTVPNLPAGSYTLTAQSVTFSGSTYTATITGSPATITAGQTADASVTYVQAAPTTGTLDVNVTGLVTIIPSVTVSDATGTVVQTITTRGMSAVNALVPGVYTIAASSVGDQNVRYDGAVTGSPATVTAGGTATATVAYAQGPALLATPAMLNLFIGGEAQTITVTEANYTGAIFEADTCTGIASISMTGAGVYTVTPEAAGMCAYTFTDSFLQTASVMVGVSHPTRINVTGTTVDTGASTNPDYQQPTIFFGSLGATASFTASEGTYTGPFTATLDPTTCGTGAAAVATVTGGSTGSFTVTSKNPGICQVTVADTNNETQVLWISVTIATFTVTGISPGATQLVVNVAGVGGSLPVYAMPTTLDVPVAFDGSIPGCTATGGVGTCTGLTVTGASQTVAYTFQAQTAGGSILGQVSIPPTALAEGSANTLAAALQPVVSTVTVTGATLVAGMPITETLTVTVLDASGTVIAGTTDFYNAITLVDGDSTGATALALNGSAATATIALTNPTASVALEFDGAQLTPVVITATGLGITGGGTIATSNAPITVAEVGGTGGLETDTAANGGSAGDPNSNELTLYLPGVGASATLSLSDPGFNNGMTFQSALTLNTGTCGTGVTAIAVVTSAEGTAGENFTVTAQAAGVCQLTFSDSVGQTTTVWVSITDGTQTIYGVSPAGQLLTVDVSAYSSPTGVAGAPSWLPPSTMIPLVWSGEGANCFTPVGSLPYCNVSLPAAEGTLSYSYDVYDASNNLLDVGSQTDDVIGLGKSNALSGPTLAGVVASVTLAAASGQPALTAGTPATLQLAVSAFDADGQAIPVGQAYASPIEFTDHTAGATSTITVNNGTYATTAEQSAYGDTLSLAYTGAAVAAPGIEISASGTGSVGQVTGGGTIPVIDQPITLPVNFPTDQSGTSGQGDTNGQPSDPNYQAATLFFTELGESQPVSPSEVGYTGSPSDGAFTMSFGGSCGTGSSAVATVSPATGSAATFTFTANAAGVCPVTFQDANGQSLVVWLSVTTAYLTFGNISPNATQLLVSVDTYNGESSSGAGFPAWLKAPVANPESIALSTSGPSANCTAAVSGGPLTCTLAVPAPPGTVGYTFMAEEANGTLLGESSDSGTYQEGTQTGSPAGGAEESLHGVVSTVTVTGGPLVAGSPGVYPLTLSAFDPSGAAITGSTTYFNAMTLSSDGPVPNVSLEVDNPSASAGAASVIVNGPSDTVGIVYQGTAFAASFQITASGSAPAGSITGGGTITAPALPPITPTSTVLANGTDAASTDPDFSQPTIFFSATGVSTTLTLTEAGYIGSPYDDQLTATLDPTTCGSGSGAVATVVLTNPGYAPGGGTFTVTSQKAGLCKLSLSDTLGQTKIVWISVTTANLSISNVSAYATRLSVTVNAVDGGSLPSWVQQPSAFALGYGGSGLCSIVSGGVGSCSGMIIPAAAPNTTYTITALDGSNNTLSTIPNVQFAITQGIQNALSIALGAVANTVSVANTVLTADDAGSVAVAVTIIDVDNHTITGTLSSPITLTDSDTSGVTLLSVNGGTPAASVVVHSGSDTVKVVYTGEAFDGPYTITPTSSATIVANVGTITESLPAVTLPASTPTDNASTGGQASDPDYDLPTLFFASTSAPAQTLSLTESGWTDKGQSFTATFDPTTCGAGASAVATISASPATSFTVSPQNVGLCKLTLENSLGQTKILWISVASATLAVNGVSPNATKLVATLTSYNGVTSNFPSWITPVTTIPLTFSGASPNCVNQSGAGVCTVGIPASPGSASYTLSAENGAAQVLGTLSNASFSITQGKSNSSLSATLQGIVSTVTISSPTLTVNVPTTPTLTVTAFDLSGAAIVGTAPYFNPITLTDNGSSSVTQLTDGASSGAAVTVSTPADIVSLVYSGEAFQNAFTITAGGSAPTGSISGSVTIQPPALAAITLSGSTSTDSAANGGVSSDPNFNQPTLFFSGTSAPAQSISVSESGWSDAPYSQGFTAALDPSTCGFGTSAVAAFSSSPATSFTVTPQNAGICKVTITDGVGQAQILWVSVTVADLTLAGVSPGASQLLATVNSVNSGAVPSWISQPGTLSLATTGGSPNCTSNGSTMTCTLAIPAAPTAASYTFTVTDGVHDLGTVTASFPIAQGKTNSLTAILEGIVASVTVPNTSLTVGTGSAPTLSVSAYDLAGYLIAPSSAGPVAYFNPITLTDTDTTGATSLSISHGTYSVEVTGGSSTVEGTADVVTIDYSGQAFAPCDITATGSAPLATSSGTLTPVGLKAITVTGTSPAATHSDVPLTGGLASDPNYNQPTFFFDSTFDVPQSFTAGEVDWSTSPYDKPFTTSLDPTTCGSGGSAVATVVANSGKSFTITPTKAGICKLSVLDGAGQSKVVWISVTAASLTLQNVPSATAQLYISVYAVNGNEPGNSGYPPWIQNSQIATLAVPGPGVSCSAPSGGVETCIVTALPAFFSSVEYYIEADDVNTDYLGSIDQTLTGLAQGVVNTGLTLSF